MNFKSRFKEGRDFLSQEVILANLLFHMQLSKNAILGIVSTLPTATKLVTECNELLPAISELLGL